MRRWRKERRISNVLKYLWATARRLIDTFNCHGIRKIDFSIGVIVMWAQDTIRIFRGPTLLLFQLIFTNTHGTQHLRNLLRRKKNGENDSPWEKNHKCCHFRHCGIQSTCLGLHFPSAAFHISGLVLIIMSIASQETPQYIFSYFATACWAICFYFLAFFVQQTLQMATRFGRTKCEHIFTTRTTNQFLCHFSHKHDQINYENFGVNKKGVDLWLNEKKNYIWFKRL